MKPVVGNFGHRIGTTEQGIAGNKAPGFKIPDHFSPDAKVVYTGLY